MATTLTDVALRPIAADDGPALRHMLADDEVSFWLTPAAGSEPLGPDDFSSMAARKAAHWAAHGFGQWLALADGEPVGRGGLQHAIVNGRGEVEIGWAVARSHWGRGVGSHIAAHGMELAHELGITSVVAFTRYDNQRSLALIARCGMTFEREFAYHGHRQLLYRRRG